MFTLCLLGQDLLHVPDWNTCLCLPKLTPQGQSFSLALGLLDLGTKEMASGAPSPAMHSQPQERAVIWPVLRTSQPSYTDQKKTALINSRHCNPGSESHSWCLLQWRKMEG